MSTPESKIVVAIETLLRGMPKATRDLSAFEKRLRSLENIKVSGTSISSAQFDKAAIAAQRLQQQQQRLAVSAQELANRQERARQATERLALSQSRLAKAQQQTSKIPTPQADAHVRAFKAIQKGAEDANKHVQFFKANEAALKKAPQVDAHVKAFRAIQKGVQDADHHVRFFRANEAALKKAPQLDSHVQAFRAIEQATRQATKEQEKAERAAFKLDRALNNVGSTLNRIGSGLSSFGRQLTVALTAPLVALGAISAKAATDIDDQTNSLKAFVGSAEAAEKRLAQLIATAQKTPGLTTNLGLLLDSNLRLANVTQETIDKVLPAIGRLNAVKNLADPARFAQNLTQLVTQNFERIDLKELVGQSPLAGQIIKEMFNVDSPINGEAIREAAQKMGLTTTEAFFAAFAEAASRNKALVNVTESISTRFAKIVDKVNVALRPLGLAIINAITPAINAVVPLIERFGKAFAELPQSVQTGLVVLGTLAALLGPAFIVLGGIVTAIGGLVTGIGAIATVIGAIGFPALLALLGGVVILLTEWAAIALVVFRSWQTNFLGIRKLVSDASEAVQRAFSRIKQVFDEVATRVLPTLRSISTKIVGTVTALWERYGSTVVNVISTSFRIVTRTLEAFIRFFGNVIDLIAKLIDGDFRGAWRAFSRIVINALQAFDEAINKLPRMLLRAIGKLNALIVRQAVRFASLGQTLALRLVLGITQTLIEAAGQVKNALVDMFVLAAAGFDPTTIAATIVARFLAAMKKAAEEGAASATPPGARSDGKGDAAKKTTTTSTTVDKKGADAIRKALEDVAAARNEFTQAQQESQIALFRQRIENEFQLAKDGLDREQSALENSFEDRLVSVKKYFADRQAMQEDALDKELIKEHSLTVALFQELGARRRAIEAELKAAIDAINQDPDLKGRAKQLTIEAAQLKAATDLEKALGEFRVQHEASQTRINILEKQRSVLIKGNARDEAILTKELREQAELLRADLLDDTGDITGAAAIRLQQRFRDSIKELRIDITSLAPELQTAINAVDLTTLKARLTELPQPVKDLIDLIDIASKRSLIEQQSVDIERQLAELRIHEATIQNRVLDGVISEKEARAAILTIQQITQARLLDTLAAQLAIAEATAGQEDEVLRIRAQIQEIERLGVVIDEVGQQLNREIFSNIEQGFEGIFQNARRGLDGLKDAAISFGESILNMLNKLAAQSITQKLEGIFKPDAENTKGTPGGFLSDLFGLKTKPADTATATALASAGTAASTALTTGGTAAGTALTTGGTAAATALATGGTTASASLISGVAAAAASFAAAVATAGAAFAASVATGSGAQVIGGLGGALGAATGMFPSVPGGAIHIVEGGYPEAVLTTDPRHAARQFQILKAYLAKTKGLFGRIPQHVIPRFETGGFISPRQVETDLLSTIQRAPSPTSIIPASALAGGGSSRSRNVRFVFVDDQRDIRNFVNSAEGEEVIVQRLIRNTLMKRSFRS